MNKRIISAALACMLALSLAACGSEGSSSPERYSINPVSKLSATGDLAMGDVMPFYDNGTYYVYHLQDTKGSNSMWYHPISCIATDDFVHYRDLGVALNFEEYYSSYDAALGTGSVIKDEEGRLHFFYTGHNAELNPAEAIRHAVSLDDGKTWIKDENFYLTSGRRFAEGYNNFRDPYLYYDEDDGLYYMLVTTRAGSNDNHYGVIDRYSAKTLSAYPEEWTPDSEAYYKNPRGSYNMECPAVFKYSGFYYLTFSEQGARRVTHYRYKKRLEDEWIIPENDAIDGEGFYAGRPAMSEDELYCFAWCAKTDTGDDYGGFDWAGNLVVHKLKQKPNGELYPVMAPGVKKAISDRVDIAAVGGGSISSVEFDGNGFSALAAGPLPAVSRMSFTLGFSEAGGNCGLTFGVKSGDNRLGNAVLAFDYASGALSYYNDVFSTVRYRDPLVSMPFAFETGKDYKVDIIIDNCIITVYLADELALTARIYSLPGNNFAFYGNGATAKLQGIKLYE